MGRRLGEASFEISTWDWFCLQLDLDLLTHRCGSGVDIWCEYPTTGDVWIRCHLRELQLDRFAPVGGWTEEGIREVLEDDVETCKDYLRDVLKRFPEIRKTLSLDRHVGYRIYIDREPRLER